MQAHGERNLDGSPGASLNPLNAISAGFMLEEVNELRKSMRIFLQEPESEERQPAFLKIQSLFGALDAVTDYSFYDLALLAQSHL